MLGLSIFLVAVLLFFIFDKYILSGKKAEVIMELFPEKDLPVLEEIKLTKLVSIKLYDLKYEDENNQFFDRDDLAYLNLVKIINTNIEFKEGIGDLEVEVELTDFTLEENRLVYMDIISMITNFNYAQFVFDGDDQFKLFSIDSDITDRIKEHADIIINKMFLHVIERISENSDSKEVQNMLSEVLKLT